MTWTHDSWLAYLNTLTSAILRERAGQCDLLGCERGPEYFLTQPPLYCCQFCLRPMRGLAMLAGRRYGMTQIHTCRICGPECRC
jgi:hypothetical protein